MSTDAHDVLRGGGKCRPHVMKTNVELSAQSELFRSNSPQHAGECISSNQSDSQTDALGYPTPVLANDVCAPVGHSAVTLPVIAPSRHMAGSSPGTDLANPIPSAIVETDAADRAKTIGERHQPSKQPVELTLRKRLTKNQSLRAEAIKNATSPIKSQSHPEHEVMFFCVDRVARRYDVSKASIWRWVTEGKFPDPVKLTNGTTRWSRLTLEAYDQNQGFSK